MSTTTPNDPGRASLLVVSIADVAPQGHPQPVELAAASPGHRRLLEEYLAELRRSAKDAIRWWNGLVEGIRERTGASEDRAQRDVWADVPAGPATHAHVLATLRRYWLRCAELNASLLPSDRVPPEQLVLGWLMELGESELVGMLGHLTYFPVGLDDKGQWV